MSNIAWPPADDAAVAKLMKDNGIQGVEVAPTRVWPDPVSRSRSEIQDYAVKWKRMGISISSMQALLFGQPELTVFQSKQQRDLTLAYLKKIIRIAGLLGAGVLVFGSPKNRLGGNLPRATVDDIAGEFFAALGTCAQENGCVFCIEPNPVAYGCDFITTSEQALELVKDVNNPGFGLHLDSAAMVMSNEDITQSMALALPRLRHFHISEPQLAPVGAGGVDHTVFASALKESNYDKWCSIEMRETETDSNLQAISSALRYVSDLYQR